jgi:hypothetical protein
MFCVLHAHLPAGVGCAARMAKRVNWIRITNHLVNATTVRGGTLTPRRMLPCFGRGAPASTGHMVDLGAAYLPQIARVRERGCIPPPCAQERFATIPSARKEASSPRHQLDQRERDHGHANGAHQARSRGGRKGGRARRGTAFEGKKPDDENECTIRREIRRNAAPRAAGRLPRGGRRRRAGGWTRRPASARPGSPPHPRAERPRGAGR